MPLTLHVISHQSRSMGSAATCQMDESGGSIGRLDINDWVLPDPDRFVSSKHAALYSEDSVWYLTDTSTNGTFHNDPAHLVGGGNTIPLNDGDHIFVGDYEIMVSITGAATTGPGIHAAEPIIDTPAQEPSIPGAGPSLDPLDSLGIQSSRPELPASPPASDLFGAAGVGGDAPLDPLQAFDDFDDAAAPAREPWPAEAGAESDHASVLAEHFVPPPASSDSIGDDWDATSYAKTADGPSAPPASPPPTPQPVAAPAPVIPPPEQPPPEAQQSGVHPTVNQPGIRPRPGDTGVAPTPPMLGDAMDASGLSILLTAMGVDPDKMPPQAAAAVFQLGGQVFREVVEGMLEVLQARDKLKSELRIARTVIQPVKNNPLKFSVTTDEAINKLMFPDSQGYMAPVEAIREAIDDIKAHQMAMMAGLRAAINSIMKQFDPDQLEAHFSKTLKRGALGGLMSKSKYWDMFREMYDDMSGDSADSILRLYGEDFAGAYQDQLDKL